MKPLLLILIAFALLPRSVPHDGYFGPPWKVELTEPSYGHPVADSGDGPEPRRFRGYKWFRVRDEYRYYDPMTYHWALYRMHDAPPNDREVLRVFPDTSVWDPEEMVRK